nr:ABC transporter ATP-binding protein [Paenibacillus caui]
MEIEEGTFVTILGASGCGKTTLLKMINRIHEPTSGMIYINGKPFNEIPATQLRRNIGYVIQQTGLFPHMTIEKNIATVPKILGWDSAAIDARIDELLEMVHLPRDFRKRYPRQLSGGQQQRVGLARALAAKPSIMLMDEPFGAIDAITRSALQNELLQIQRSLATTILFVTHDIEEAMKLGDKVIIMNEGEIQQFDEPLEIIMRPKNEFVRRLTQSTEGLQRLSYIKISQAALAERQEGSSERPTIGQDESVMDALQSLLLTGAKQLAVRDANGTIVGALGLDQIRPYLLPVRNEA